MVAARSRHETGRAAGERVCAGNFSYDFASSWLTLKAINNSEAIKNFSAEDDKLMSADG
jgi:hypothetical protein